MKTGPSYFRYPKHEAGEVTGWWYVDKKGEELGLWAAYPTQQIVVLHDLDTRTSYWEHVSADAIRPAGQAQRGGTFVGGADAIAS